MAASVPLNNKSAVERLRIIDDLADRCRELAAMDFDFLYDRSRGLLTIGYDVGERRRDPACYDLLASEARLASFLLIAQGQIPQKHWFALGPPADESWWPCKFDFMEWFDVRVPHATADHAELRKYFVGSDL